MKAGVPFNPARRVCGGDRALQHHLELGAGRNATLARRRGCGHRGWPLVVGSAQSFGPLLVVASIVLIRIWVFAGVPTSVRDALSAGSCAGVLGTLLVCAALRVKRRY